MLNSTRACLLAALLLATSFASPSTPMASALPGTLEEPQEGIVDCRGSTTWGGAAGSVDYPLEHPCYYVGFIDLHLAGLAFLVVPVVFLGVNLALGLALGTAFDVVELAARMTMQADQDADEIGDDWERDYDVTDLSRVTDADGDDLDLLHEFYWLSNPTDPDSDNDAWMDGPEASYWKTIAPALGQGTSYSNAGQYYASPSQGAFLDTDQDRIPNMWDPDSDTDGLFDGDELHRGAKPEALDTDGDGLIDGGLANQPGEALDSGTRPDLRDSDNDAWDDSTEFTVWKTRYGLPNTLTLDTDGDGAINVLDKDSDNDELTDGQETSLGLDPANPDTDADGMPDGWEIQYTLNPLLDDASLDSDADGWDQDGNGLADASWTNLQEYQYHKPGLWNEWSQGPWTGGTNPSDADTEGDGLTDGEELFNHTTNPHAWDTDADGMPDSFEVQYALNPLNSADALLDLDGDSFDQGNDGSIQQEWPNLSEYRYARPATHDEASQGPWLLGTDPRNIDTDGDGAGDGQEAYFGTQARLPDALDSDDDEDGLTWAQEARLGTNPVDADTDGDGLCDGSRGAACHVPGLNGVGNQPGEEDYGSVAWLIDSDHDGLSDGQEALAWDPTASGQAQDVEGDLLNGVIDSDSDNDDLTDGQEHNEYLTNMALADTDLDRLEDGAEVASYHTDPRDPDSDRDGLNDGDELEVHTRPLISDSDNDGLLDGAEVKTHGTDPLSRDTDQDRLPDAWEVQKGTNARAADTDVDHDADELSAIVEYKAGTHPVNPDTDGDTMADGYELRHGLNPLSAADKLGDFDGDELSNVEEAGARTNPADSDSDNDGKTDGWEVKWRYTDALNPDTDGDGLMDGPEEYAWGAQRYQWSTDYDGDTLNSLRDVDSDNDGLTDREEFQDTKSDPRVKDTDGDGLSDFDEVVTYGGQYDPNQADTDGDGLSDKDEVALDDKNGDFDGDGIQNGVETGTYGTDPAKADTDCDGVRDGPELAYWSTFWDSWGNRLLNADVDGDGIKDGVEIGTVGTPGQVMYRTRPDRADTDSDGLWDDAEARNAVRVTCGTAHTQSASSSLGEVSLTGTLGIVQEAVEAGANGLRYVLDEAGGYILGGYGVHLIPDGVTLAELLDVQAGTMAGGAPAPGNNGKLTNPELWDTDGDRLSDGEELNVRGTSATSCDTDNDALGDALEVGLAGTTRDVADVCTHRDSQPSQTSNPRKNDSDNDRFLDSTEDKNRNGRLDPLESNPLDGDTDDDGILDSNEGIQRTLVDMADSDRDGLSDGLEIGLASPQTDLTGMIWTSTSTPLVTCGNAAMRKAWMPFQGSSGILTAPKDADSDNDGILDGLEDLNHNGVFGDNGELYPRDVGSKKGNDYDNDKLLDGLELLLWGQSSSGGDGSLTYDFCQIASLWGSNEDSWANHLAFNSAEPFQTDPRSSTSDEDTVPDGNDLNPRSDASVAVEFGKFFMREDYDVCTENVLELYVKELSLTLPFNLGEYVIHMGSGAYVPIPDARTPKLLDGELINKLKSPSRLDGRPGSTLEALWYVDGVADGARRVLQFDIPDNVGVDNVDLSNTAVTVSVKAWDNDDWWCNGQDNSIDLNPLGAEEALTRTINLVDDARGTYSPDNLLQEGSYQAWNGLETIQGDKRKGDDDEDGSLEARMGDAVPSFFLANLNQIRLTGMSGLPAGTCYGGPATDPTCQL